MKGFEKGKWTELAHNSVSRQVSVLMVFSLRNASPKNNDTAFVYAGWGGGGLALSKTCERIRGSGFQH